jgi:hypothetical protein
VEGLCAALAAGFGGQSFAGKGGIHCPVFEPGGFFTVGGESTADRGMSERIVHGAKLVVVHIGQQWMWVVTCAGREYPQEASPQIVSHREGFRIWFLVDELNR